MSLSKIIFCLLMFFAALPASAESLLEKKNIYPIPDILSGIENEFFSTEGYVVYINECKGCPEEYETVCAPCPKPYIIITEQFIDYKKEKPVNALQLTINEAQIFEVGKKYMLLIRKISRADSTSDSPAYYYVTDYHEIPDKEE